MLKIRQVVKITNISEFDLRNWEKRYGFPKPQRTNSGQRLFSEKEVEALILTKKEHKKGVPPKRLAEIYFSYLEDARFTGPLKGHLSEYGYQFIGALVDYDINAADRILSDLGKTMDFSEIVKSILVPSLQVIGDFWHSQKVNIAQEHFATLFIRSKFFQYISADADRKLQHRCLFGTLPGEAHEGALLALACLIKAKGIMPYYLGTQIPLSDFIECEKEIKPQLICLSTLDRNHFESNLQKLGEFKSTVLIGGYGADPSLPAPENVKILSLNALDDIVSFIEGFIRSH